MQKRQNEEYDTRDTDDGRRRGFRRHRPPETTFVQYCAKRFTGISICASIRRRAVWPAREFPWLGFYLTSREGDQIRLDFADRVQSPVIQTSQTLKA